MSCCINLETFPPISGMTKLETLNLNGCLQLCNFPEIRMNMENMVRLSLRKTKIKGVPSSIGRYCTNLISLDLGECESLESIEGNFHLLKHLKVLNLEGCEKLKLLEQGLFDANVPPGMKFLGFSPSLRKLNLHGCHLGDISSVLCELSNLQVLDLGGNDFSRLHCSLLQLRSLKVLNLSYCHNLVELPDLPESIAVLHAYGCRELIIVDLPTNLRWLWRISVSVESISGDGRKVQSMLQGNAVRDYSISLLFHDQAMPIRDIGRTLMLELPWNWYNEFSGFLICINVGWPLAGVITIKDVMSKESEDVLEVSDGTPNHTCNAISYIYLSFGSLRHTSWWNSEHTTISFSIDDRHTNLKVELVPGRSKGDSIERVKDTTNSSKFWNTEPIAIISDSESCIKIQWDHDYNDLEDLFNSDAY